MKQQTAHAKRSLQELTYAARGIRLSSTQTVEIMEMIEDFMWNIIPSILSTQDDGNGNFRKHAAYRAIEEGRRAMIKAATPSDTAYDRAMKALGDPSLKWTELG